MDREALFDILNKRLSSSELRILCFDLGIEYDELRGETKPEKAMGLIEYLEHRDQLVNW